MKPIKKESLSGDMTPKIKTSSESRDRGSMQDNAQSAEFGDEGRDGVSSIQIESGQLVMKGKKNLPIETRLAVLFIGGGTIQIFREQPLLNMKTIIGVVVILLIIEIHDGYRHPKEFWSRFRTHLKEVKRVGETWEKLFGKESKERDYP